MAEVKSDTPPHDDTEVQDLESLPRDETAETPQQQQQETEEPHEHTETSLEQEKERKSKKGKGDASPKKKRKHKKPNTPGISGTVPGQIPEAQDDQSTATSYTTQLDTTPRAEQDQQAVAEPLPTHEEIDFPTEIHQTSTPGKDEKTSKPVNSADFENRDFDTLDPKDYGIDFDEEEISYEPPERDDTLPDLYRLIDSLQDGDTDLEGRSDPPSLFTRPEHLENYKKISELKLEIEEEDIHPYIDDFTHGIKDDVLMIGSISLEEVQEEELRLRDEHIAYTEQEMKAARQRQQQLVLREEEAKKRVARELKERRRLIKRRQELLQQKERLMMDRLHKSFRRAENQLLSNLEKRKGEVKTMYGDLTLSDGHYGGSKGRRWKVDWNETPQPVQIKVKTLRGIKDKLPMGRYVMMVSMYDRLGGHVLRWSNLKGQQWGGTTLPTTHDGHFYNVEIKVDQSVFTVLPSKPNVRPGMVLVFELYLLRGAVMATDRVVSWGCFPITNAEFDIVEGKFKCPMLRGEMDFMIDRHDKIEELISSDVDHWLSNLYFEIIKLPRYLAGQKEYEVELQFTSGVLSYPDRVNTGGEECRDGEMPVPGSLPDIRSEMSDEVQPLQPDTDVQSRNSSRSSQLQEDDDDSVAKKPFTITERVKARLQSAGSEISEKPFVGMKYGARPTTMVGSRALYANKKVKVAEDEDSDEYDEEDVYLMKKNGGFQPVKGQPGMYYKQYLSSPLDTYTKQMYTLLPKTPLLTRKTRRKRLTYLEELEEHKFAVKKQFDDKGHLKDTSYEKLQYVSRQMMAELGLSQWRSREFWLMLTMFVLIFFMRMYLHYVAQWLFLTASKIPINKFNFLPYTVELNYQPSLLQVADETLVVLLGPLGNILVFALFVTVSWICQRLIGNFPDVASKFIVVYGIHAFLNPITILIIDCALQRWKDGAGDDPIGDLAKLYWHFDRTQGSGLAGIFITIVLYIFTMFAAGTILYMYFLRLHNNGRMLDIYWRLQGLEDMFFVPYDLEISNQELNYIIKKAEQWRGEEGERRKVAIYDYIWEEEPIEDTVWDENGEAKTETKEGKQEITTHASIHTLHLDGLRELYRHWLRLPDGAIVEVFGDMSMAGLDKDLSKALTEGTTNLENIGSQTNLRKVPGRQSAYTNAAFRLDDEDNLPNTPRASSVASLKKTQ